MKTRLLSIAGYLGLAPELWLVTSKENKDPLLHHHIQQAFSLSLLGLFCFLLILIVQVLEYEIGSAFPLTDQNPYRAADVLSLLPSLACWLLLGVGLWRAAVGSASPLPVVARLSANRMTRLGSIIWGFLFQLICILLLILPLRMNYITRPQDRPASVYMLYPQERFQPFPYTSLGTFTVPRWVFTLGFYPIAEIATARWGDGSVAVEPLTRANLNEAFQYGRLVVVASHGGYPFGTIPLSRDPEDHYSPADVALGGVSSNLQLVYLAGCYIGALENDWENALAPARVITFNRISWESEHVYWLWFIGPGLASELK